MQPRDTSCLFCAIAAGHVPCHAVYEDEHLLAFLDHRPLNPGHVLVVPKRHEPDFHRLASARYGALMQLAHRLGQCLAHLYQPPKVGLFVIGLHVPHVHVHVVPLYAMADMTAEAFERAQRTSPGVAVLVDSAAQIRHALAVMEEDDIPASGWHA
jgi:histidine triad (HIT) family protein